MDHEHACRISRPSKYLETVWENWAKTSAKVLVYEHVADDEISVTHCHVLIQECAIGEEGLKKRIKSLIQLSGNKDWSFTDRNGKDAERYIIYMTKGHLNPVYNKGYDPEYLEACKAKWHSCRPTAKEQENLNDTPRNEMIKTEPKDSQLIQMWMEFQEHVFTHNLNDHMELKDFRGIAILWWRKRSKGLMPTGPTFNRFLVSVYLEYRDRKHLPLTEQAIDEVCDKM